MVLKKLTAGKLTNTDTVSELERNAKKFETKKKKKKKNGIQFKVTFWLPPSS